MKDLATVIYEKFFMRDLLGKFAPGFVTLLVILEELEIDLPQLAPHKDWFWLYGVAAIAICLLIGIALQVTGEFVGLHSASPYPRRIFFFFKACGRWEEANKDLPTRLEKFINAPENKIKNEARSQRERLVYLKEGTGNFALALLVLSLSLSKGMVFDPETTTKGATLAILYSACVILWICHVLHAKRQALFEITVLQGAGILKEKKAEEMKGRLPKWLP